MGFGALIHADSRSPDGVRLTTFEISFPRCILAELNTHRMLSKSSASSRAIPVEKMLKRVMEDPYVPTSWGKNQKGMQAEQEVNAETAEMAKTHWLELRSEAVWKATMLRDLGIHKQITNRLLEPFLWHTCIVTGTEWSNFFHLRNNPQASPDFQTIAEMMQELYDELEPEEVDYGEWHMPLVGPEHAYPVSSQRYRWLWPAVYSNWRVWGNLGACQTRAQSKVTGWLVGAPSHSLRIGVGK